jgi:DNA replication protein DnaC
MGYLNLRPEQSNAFFKLMEERYVGKHTTIITTNLPYEAWYEFLGNKKMVEALLDRMRERCHTITIDGPSLRSPLVPAP